MLLRLLTVQIDHPLIQFVHRLTQFWEIRPCDALLVLAEADSVGVGAVDGADWGEFAKELGE